MKKTLHIILLLTSVFYLASCEKDTSVTIPSPQVKVIESNIIFEAAGGEGFINVEAPGAITATSSEEWCVPSVSDKKINLAIATNEGLNGRTATITIEYAKQSISVSVVQSGIIYWIKDLDKSIAYPLSGGSLHSATSSSFPITVESKPDWISCEIGDKTLSIIAAPGTTLRTGEIVFVSNKQRMTFQVNQAGYEAFLGEWEYEYEDFFSGKIVKSTVKFASNIDKKSYTIEDLAIGGPYMAKIKVDYNPATHLLIIKGGQYLAEINNAYVYLCHITAAGSYSWSTTRELGSRYIITKEGTVICNFVDIGSTPGFIAGGTGYFIFKGQPPASENAAGSHYGIMMNLKFTKK